MIFKNTVEMTIGKGGQYEAHIDVDDKTKFVVKDITNVRFYDEKLGKWIDIGYQGPVSLDFKEG